MTSKARDAACGHLSGAKESGVLHNLDGWSVSLCPSCGTTVGEWLTEDGPDVVEYEECWMCVEAAAEEDWWY